jgi:hypothetical protein
VNRRRALKMRSCLLRNSALIERTAQLNGDHEITRIESHRHRLPKFTCVKLIEWARAKIKKCRMIGGTIRALQFTNFSIIDLKICEDSSALLRPGRVSKGGI